MLWTAGVLPWQWYDTRQYQQQSYSSSCFAYTIVVSQNVSTARRYFRSFSLVFLVLNTSIILYGFSQAATRRHWVPVEFQLSAKRARLSTVILAIFIHGPITHGGWVGDPHGISQRRLWTKNENFDDMFSHFDTITACDRRTGGQIDRWTVRPADRWHSW